MQAAVKPVHGSLWERPKLRSNNGVASFEINTSVAGTWTRGEIGTSPGTADGGRRHRQRLAFTSRAMNVKYNNKIPLLYTHFHAEISVWIFMFIAHIFIISSSSFPGMFLSFNLEGAAPVSERSFRNCICWVFKWDDLLCIWFLYSVTVHTKKPTDRSDWRVKNARFLRPENKVKEIINYQKIWNAFQKIAINETSLSRLALPNVFFRNPSYVVRTLLTVYYSFHPQSTTVFVLFFTHEEVL